MIFKLLFLISILIGCTSQPPTTSKTKSQLSIHEVNPNKWTNLTRKNLEQLFQVYDLNSILFTKEIHIESRVIPHSHPVLTLNTRHAEEPFKLLSVFIHEQLHWWLEIKKEDFFKMKIELQKLYPELPTTGGAKDAHSTYLHLALCTLEYELLIHYLGESEAALILNDLIHKDKIYPWIYTEVQKNFNNLKAMIKSHGLRPGT